MLSWANFRKHPLTTLGGALLGMIQFAAISAAAVFTKTGNVSDPKPYIAAAGAGAATFIIGGLLPSGIPAPADTPVNTAALVAVPKPAETAEQDLAAPAEAAAPLQTSAEPAAASVVPPEVVTAAGEVIAKLVMDRLLSQPAPAAAPAAAQE